MKPFSLFLAMVLSLIAALPATAQTTRTSYVEYKFDDLDENTRTAIGKINSQLAKFSEGCVAEQDKATYALFDALIADSTCGLAVATAVKTKSKIAAGTAVIACGWGIPKALRERAERKENLRRQDPRRLRVRGFAVLL